MSSGEIEDDSINTQTKMQIHAQPRVFKGRSSIAGSGNPDPFTKEELDSSEAQQGDMTTGGKNIKNDLHQLTKIQRLRSRYSTWSNVPLRQMKSH